MTSILEKLIAIIAPHYCIMCSEEGNMLCDRCAHDFPVASLSYCFACDAAAPNGVCKTCTVTTHIEHVWTIGLHEGVLRQLIRSFKFNRARAAVYPLAKLLAHQLPVLENFCIVPLPTASTRVRQRGYDQTVLLARELAKRIDLPFTPLLGRKTQHRQVGRGRLQRILQAEQAFYIKDPAACMAAKVLLVDDVSTTGATLRAAAKILRAAGADTVYAAILAKQRTAPSAEKAQT